MLGWLRRSKWLAIAAATALGALAVVGLVRWRFHGQPLGGLVENLVNSRIRGQLAIGSVDWPIAQLGTLISGGWVDVQLNDVEVWDDQVPRKLVAKVATITAQVDVHALLAPPHHFVFRHVKTQGGYVLIEEVEEPFPLHDFDRSTYSIMSAFYGAQQPSFRVGINGRSGTTWDIQDFSVRDFTVDLKIARDDDEGFLYTSHSTQVSSDGFLYYDGTDPLLSKMYFSLAPTAGPTVVRIFDNGRRADYEIPMAKVSLPRLAQLPHGWPRSAAANSLEVAIAGTTSVATTADGTPVEGASVTITGQLADWWDRPYDGRWDLHVKATNLGPTLGAIVSPSLHGEAVTASIDLTGPYAALPRVDVALSGLSYDVFVDAKSPPIELQLDTLEAYIDMVNYRGAVKKTVGRGAGGELLLTAEFGLSGRPYTSADIVITKPFDIGRYLPREVRRAVGGKLGGRFHLRLGKRAEDADPSIPEESILVDNIAVSLGTLALRGGSVLTEMRFRADVEKSSVESVAITGLELAHKATRVRVGGTIGVVADTIDLDVNAESGNLAPLLAMLDVPAVVKTGQAKAHISGTLSDPSVDASVTAGGVVVAGEVSAQLAYRQGRLRLTSLSTPRMPPSTKASLDLQVRPSMYLHGAELRTGDLDVGKLPALPQLHGGRISALALAPKGLRIT
ncbi:MAG: hypothetical protein IPL79_03870 [Myxococcales bacterium]|nr:hypothetical protein [Myxococcales bacterium]